MHRWEDNIRKDLTGIGWEAAVRVKVKLSLCLIKHHAINMYGEVEIWVHAFLIMALDESEW